MTKDKTVRIKEDEVKFIEEYISPPDASHMIHRKQEQGPFHTIDMDQQDRFFYQKNDDDDTSNSENSNNNNSPHRSWSSTQTITESELRYYNEQEQKTKMEEEEEEEKVHLFENVSPEQQQIEDDNDDEEFDWNDDPDQIKRRQSKRERLHSAICCWHYLSPFIKRVIIALSGSLVFICIGIIIYFTLPEPTEAERSDPGFKNIRSNVQCWMYWAAVMWHLFWLTTFLFDLVPPIVSLWTKKFRGVRSEKMKSKMEYYMRLKEYFCLFLLTIWNLGCWLFLINHPFESIKRHSYSGIITRTFGCLIAASALFFVQKAIIQIIAIRFHRTAYKDRLVENKKSLKILDALSRSEGKKSRPGSATQLKKKQDANGSSYTKSEESEGRKRMTIQLTDNDTKRDTNGQKLVNRFQKKISKIVLAEKPSASIDKPQKADINSDDYAKKVARKLFHALAHPHYDLYYGTSSYSLNRLKEFESQDFSFSSNATTTTNTTPPKKHLDIDSFLPYFQTRDEAEEAFSIFDKDGNRNLTRREFRDTVVQIYRERKGLAQSMRDTSQALGKIDQTLLIIQLLLTTFICLAIFQVDFWKALVPFGTILAACTFVFDSSARGLCQGIMFQFVTHPYDSGDMVMIDGSYMTVENIGLLGTVFETAEGVKVYAPTDVLLTKFILNVRRSGNMGEVITINIDFRTDNILITTLKERLDDWLKGQTRDFDQEGGFDVRVTDIIDMNQVILRIWLPHKGNWVELSKRFQRKTRFMLALKTILTELNIKYELPAQKITSDGAFKRHPFENL